VLSDLHLGHSGCLVGEVGRLRPLLDGAATVVFNGDTAEERAEVFRPRSEEMLAGLRDLCRSLGARTVFVTGNHDPGISGCHYLDLAGGQVFVTHGDTLFPLVAPWGKRMPEWRGAVEAILAEYPPEGLQDLDRRMEMTRRASRVTVPFDHELGHNPLERALTLLAELWPPRRPWAIGASWLAAPGLAFGLLGQYRPDAQVIVFGHTHCPGQWWRRGRCALNTGGFLTVLNARVVEVVSGEVSLTKVQHRKGEFVPGPRRTLHPPAA
jgi:exonuclease SbcD